MYLEELVEPPCKRICVENSKISCNNRYVEVGIEEFFDNNGVGFSGKIKERWEDFIVNEVDLNNYVVVLENTDLPLAKSIHMNIENKHLSESVINELQNLSTTPCKKEVIFDAPDDKLIRTDIYNFLKSNYSSLYGNTELKDGKRVFIVTNYEDERSQIAKKISKTSGDDDYCQFVLYKEGKDTMSAIGLIAKYLKMKPGSFTYAGTKDRRGITSQLVRVRSCAANRLKGLNKCLNGIVLGNFSYHHTPLKLGDLYGNRFRLVIRDVQGSDEDIETAINRFKKGFINYFGMQRFGSTEIRSHEIGKLAIASKWEDMIKLILEPTPQDLPFMRECKIKFKETQNIDEFLKASCNGIERSIVSGIAKHGYILNAIDTLPRNLKQLYVHSYQSYVWNKMASMRMRECGNSMVMAGDLIETGDQQVIVVDEADVNKYTIADVVLPLPGYDVKLPENQVADWYGNILGQDNVTMKSLRHKVKDFSLPGSYRKLIVEPENLQFSIHKYEDSTIPLIESDHHRLINDFKSPPSQGSLKAVILEFTLPKSAYATIAVRELMKTAEIIQ